MAPPRVLLVEDEKTTRDLLQNVLLAEGYSVDAACTLAEAMAYLEQRTYDLVLTDWRLPDGNGLLVADTAEELGARTLVMSGYLFQMAGGQADRHETLMKPLRPSELVAAVERHLGKAYGA